MRQLRSLLALLAATAVLAPAALAHVRVDAPNGGEILQSQSIFTIEWVDTINHGTGVTYEIELSTDGGTTWVQVVNGLPYTGGTSAYDWLVPNLDTDQARIRVTMHVSATTTYDDTSDADFTILPSFWYYGTGTAVAGVEPQIEGHGVPGSGQSMTVHVSQAEVGAVAHLIAGTARTNFRFAGVTVLTRPTLTHLTLTVDPNGEVIVSAALPAALLGRTVNVQALMESSPGFSATRGMEFTVLP